MSHTTISEVARQFGVRPRDISDLFYSRVLDESVCPIVGGRRMIPQAYVAAIKAALEERGRLTQTASRIKKRRLPTKQTPPRKGIAMYRIHDKARAEKRWQRCEGCRQSLPTSLVGGRKLCWECADRRSDRRQLDLFASMGGQR